MSAGPTSLHVFGDKFRELAEAATGGAVRVRLFPSGTLGQEREVVQQLQEGLVDFMVSGTAIWGSVAPRLQVFDFPFLWRDWAHVTASSTDASGVKRPSISSGRCACGRSRGGLVRLSPGGHAVARRHRGGAAGRPEDPDDPVAHLRQGGGIDGRQPDADGVRRGLYVDADGCHRRLRARREHDVQQRFYEVARCMARTRHIAGVLGLFASTAGLARIPPPIRAAARAGRARRRRLPANEGTAGGHHRGRPAHRPAG